MRRLPVALALAAGFYLLLTVALTWPLALHFGDRVPNDLGDSLLNVFLMSWNARETPLTQAWWNLPMFHPIPGVMAFSEHLLGQAIFTTPIIAATDNPLLAYNVAFFVSFPLCALGAHLLGYEITRRHDLALVAGVAYGFAAYRMSQLAHIQVLSAYWIPLALLGLHRFVRTRRRRWAVLFAVSWLMQALACGYYLFYLSVLIGLWLLWFALGRLRWAELGFLLAAWAAAMLALAPVALGYLKFQRAYGLRRWPDEIESFSADVASILKAPANLRLWGWLNAVERPESDLFPGAGILLVIAAGVAVAWVAAARSAPARLRAARVLLGLAALVAFVAATPALFGSWRLEVAGVRLLSVGTPHKPLSIAALLAAGALALHPSIRLGWSRRSALAFYTLAAIVCWMFALGPSPTLLGEPVLYKAPYAWLMELPGVDGVRVPARFWVLGTMCLAVAAGLAIGHLGSRWPRARRALPAVVVAILLVEAWPTPLALERPPDPRPAEGRAAVRLEVPIGSGSDLVALYRAASHGRPLFNGYSGYVAPHYPALRQALDSHDGEALRYLTRGGPIEVTVDHALDPHEGWRRFIGGYPEGEVLHRGERYTSYRLPRSPAAAGLPVFSSGSLPLAGIEASLHQPRVGEMLDGDIVTRWDTGGPQRPGHELLLDLGQVRAVEGIELQVGGFIADFPRHLVVELSDDRRDWREGWAGPTARLALMGGLEHPLEVPLRVPLRHARARYIRLRQVASDPVYYWSTAELRVHGS